MAWFDYDETLVGVPPGQQPIRAVDAAVAVTHVVTGVALPVRQGGADVSEVLTEDGRVTFQAEQMVARITALGRSRVVMSEQAKLAVPAAGQAVDANVATLVNDTASQTRAALSGTYGLIPDNGARAVGQGELLSNVRDFGAIGDGFTNDTAAIQACIDAVAATGGGVAFMPRGDYLVTGLVLKAGVSLSSLTPHRGYGYNVWTARIKTTTPGATVIDTPIIAPGGGLASSRLNNPCVQGITIDGGGVASIGIRYRRTIWGAVKNCHLNSFTDQGLLVDVGVDDNVGGEFRDILAMNCLLDQTRTAPAGAVEIYGADHKIEWIECTASQLALSDVNHYLTSIIVGCSNSYVSDLMAEISDIGVRVTGNYNRFSNCRADLTYAHGWLVTGTKNTFTSCHAVGCGRAAANAYSGFRVSGTGNRFSSCQGVHAAGATLKYGIEDLVANGVVALRNVYDQSCGGDGTTASFIAVAWAGSGKSHPPLDFHPADAATTVVVRDTSLVVLDLYTVATTVTSFTGGTQGQTVRVVSGGGFVTIQHGGGGNLRTNTLANKLLAAGRVYSWTMHNGVWYEQA